MSNDPYGVLGVGRDASPEEIQEAYRQLALEHHPDRNPNDPEASKKFIQIQDAYEELVEPERRKPVAAYHTHASIYQTVWVHRKPTRRARTSGTRKFTPLLIAVGTVIWLFMMFGFPWLLARKGLTENPDSVYEEGRVYRVETDTYELDPDYPYSVPDDNPDAGPPLSPGCWRVYVTFLYVLFILFVHRVAASKKSS